MCTRVLASSPHPPLNLPSPRDCRHPREEVLRLQRELRLRGDTLGLYHFFIWVATGQYDVSKKNKNTKLLLDLLKTLQRIDALTKFLARVKTLWETIGQLFQTIDRIAYDSYKQTVRAQLADTAFGRLIDCEAFVFAGFALIINLCVAPHHNVRDVPEGWVAIAPHGQFVGGDLIVEELEVRLPFPLGLVAFLNFQKLTHSIAPFPGTRYKLVCAMHANLSPTAEEMACFLVEAARRAEVAKVGAARNAERRRVASQAAKKARQREARLVYSD